MLNVYRRRMTESDDNTSHDPFGSGALKKKKPLLANGISVTIWFSVIENQISWINPSRIILNFVVTALIKTFWRTFPYKRFSRNNGCRAMTYGPEETFCFCFHDHASIFCRYLVLTFWICLFCVHYRLHPSWYVFILVSNLIFIASAFKFL